MAAFSSIKKLPLMNVPETETMPPAKPSTEDEIDSGAKEAAAAAADRIQKIRGFQQPLLTGA